MSQWPCPASSCSHSLELGLCAKWVIPVQRDILGVSLNYPPWSTQNSLSRSSPLFKSLIAHIFFWWPLGSHGKEASCNAGDLGSITGLGRSPGERNGNPLQYSCLGNPMERKAWRAAVHGVKKSWTRLSDQHFNTLFSSYPYIFFSGTFLSLSLNLTTGNKNKNKTSFF